MYPGARGGAAGTGGAVVAAGARFTVLLIGLRFGGCLGGTAGAPRGRPARSPGEGRRVGDVLVPVTEGPGFGVGRLTGDGETEAALSA